MKNNKSINKKILAGHEFEKSASLKFHREGIPVLIASNFLRSRGAGQVDACRLKKHKSSGEWLVEILEVKLGENITKLQQKRLKVSLALICNIFHLSGFIRYEHRNIKKGPF